MASAYPINAPKPKWRQKTPSPWVKNIGQLLRKTEVDDEVRIEPYEFDPTKDKKELNANLFFDNNISLSLKDKVHKFVIDYWDVFCEAGVSVPVTGYESVIDTRVGYTLNFLRV
eukprot:3896206-Ditylum_brightwellii.AAC.1